MQLSPRKNASDDEAIFIEMPAVMRIPYDVVEQHYDNVIAHRPMRTSIDVTLYSSSIGELSTMRPVINLTRDCQHNHLESKLISLNQPWLDIRSSH